MALRRIFHIDSLVAFATWQERDGSILSQKITDKEYEIGASTGQWDHVTPKDAVLVRAAQTQAFDTADGWPEVGDCWLHSAMRDGQIVDALFVCVSAEPWHPWMNAESQSFESAAAGAKIGTLDGEKITMRPSVMLLDYDTAAPERTVIPASVMQAAIADPVTSVAVTTDILGSR